MHKVARLFIQAYLHTSLCQLPCFVCLISSLSSHYNTQGWLLCLFLIFKLIFTLQHTWVDISQLSCFVCFLFSSFTFPNIKSHNFPALSVFLFWSKQIHNLCLVPVVIRIFTLFCKQTQHLPINTCQNYYLCFVFI